MLNSALLGQQLNFTVRWCHVSSSQQPLHSIVRWRLFSFLHRRIVSPKRYHTHERKLAEFCRARVLMLLPTSVLSPWSSPWWNSGAHGITLQCANVKKYHYSLSWSGSYKTDAPYTVDIGGLRLDFSVKECVCVCVCVQRDHWLIPSLCKHGGYLP